MPTEYIEKTFDLPEDTEPRRRIVLAAKSLVA
jgi:hypothetical protein